MSVPDPAVVMLLEDPPKDLVEAIYAKLDAFNSAAAPTHDPNHMFCVAVTGAEVFGGLIGFTYGGWLFVDSLWVAQTHRRTGLGRRLMAIAEEEAIKRGCHSAHTDTFTFQAPEFYAALGYEVFGELDGFDGGHSRFYLRKRLIESA